MKSTTNTARTLIIQCLISATLFFASCQDDDGKAPAINDSEKKEKVAKVLAFREELDIINRFVDKNVTGNASEEGRRSFASNPAARIKEAAPCGDVTEEELPDGSIKVTLNFGDGCLTEEGVEVIGSVVMLFKFDENSLEYKLDFTDYSEIGAGPHQGELVNGTVKGSFMLAVQAGRYVQRMDQDLVTTWLSSNEQATYRATQIAEMKGDGLHVTAFTTGGILNTGENFNTSLSKNVVYDFSCEGNLPTSGEESVTLMGSTIVVNYGDGNCDKVYSVK